MPGKRRTAASRIRGGRPVQRSKGIAARPRAAAATGRGATLNRQVKRNLRRKQINQQAAKVTQRPRPAVRPSRTPSRVMSAAQPRVTRARAAVRPGRTAQPSARQIKRAVRAGAVAAAGTFLTLNAQRAHPDISDQVSSIQSSLNQLQERASLSELQTDLVNLDSNLSHALNLLESARDKGYRYQKDLEEIAYKAMSRWQSIRDEVENQVAQQQNLLQSTLTTVDAAVQQMNSRLGGSSAGGELNSLERTIRDAANNVSDVERDIHQAYDDIESQASELTRRLTRIHWALTQRDEASFEFDSQEDLYMAVASRWDKEGKEDPEGVLFLTNRRLLFEQKEKVATKKVLFVTTASEMVQQLLVDKPLAKVKSIKVHNKGVFGHQDFLDVSFDDQTVPFHLDGQDSEDWGRMIKDAQSGKIEDDRASGAGLKFSDLTGELSETDILDLQQEVNELQDEMMLKAVQGEIGELENQLNTLGRELGELRTRGYVVEKALEADIQVLAAQWEKIKTRTKATIELQTKLLSGQMSAIQSQMAELAGMTGSLAAARPKFIQLKSAIASAEGQAEAAEQTVLHQYDAYADEVESLDAHLEWVDWMLDALENASFKLLATESGVAAVEAIWERTGLEPENGILFLTDQRLLWEDRVGDFELKVDVPVSAIEDAKLQTDEGSEADELVLKLGKGAPVAKGFFELAQPVGEAWLQMIGRARSGGYNEDRAVEIDPADLKRIRNAPSQCSNCGGAFTAPILRGQNEIVCEYCGVSERI